MSLTLFVGFFFCEFKSYLMGIHSQVEKNTATSSKYESRIHLLNILMLKFSLFSLRYVDILL